MAIRPIKLVPKRGVDFRKAIEDPAYAHVFFLFNDSLDRHETSEASAGSATIRPWNHLSKNVRSFGISTHDSTNPGRFSRLTQDVRRIIINHCRDLREILEKNDCTEIWLPGDDNDKFATRTGAGVSEDVVDGIMFYLQYYTEPMDGSMQ